MSDQAPTPTYETITLGVGRDNARKLEQRRIQIPTNFAMKVSDMDADKVRAALESMQETIASLLVMLAEGEQKMAEMADEGASKQELAAKITEHEQMLAQLKEEMSKASDALGIDPTKVSLSSTVASVKTERDNLLAEVEPLRAAELSKARDVAEKLGVAKDALDGKTLAEVRRLAVVHKHGEVMFGKASDDKIAGVFFGLATVSSPTPVNDETPAAPLGRSTLSAVPELRQPTTARDENKPPTAAAQMNAGLDALG